jgi:hypothetical protein
MELFIIMELEQGKVVTLMAQLLKMMKLNQKIMRSVQMEWD